MKNGWKIVKLGKVLKPSENWVSVVPTDSYKLLGMSLEGRGLFVREEKLGSEVSAKYLNKVIPGEFMYSRLFAWKGAFDKAAKEFDGCFVSDEYPAFQPDKDKLDIDYLTYFFLQKSVWTAVEQFCIGVTKASRNRFKEKFFLDFEIPLPPLSEQQRIAGRLAALKGKMDAVRALRGEQVREVERIAENAFDFVIPNAEFERRKIGEVSTFKTGKTPPTSHPHYFEGDLDWYCPSDINNQKDCYLQGSSKKISQDALDDNKATWYESETILLISIGGTIGKVGILKEPASSNQQITGIKFNESVLPEYGCYWLKKSKAEIINRAAQATLPIINQKKIAEIEIAIPPLSEQRRIVAEIQAFQTKMAQLKAAQAGQLAGLEGLFPAVLEKAFRGEW
ncbi:MAG: restriction endonuclease subunit S [Saprospiraceae bacterium]|nr:restriction endonuclease subunit S [Saprospiraceae bacterium]